MQLEQEKSLSDESAGDSDASRKLVIVDISSENENRFEGALANAPDPSDELGDGMEKLSIHSKATEQTKAANFFGVALP